MVHDDQFGIGLAVENQISEGIEDHRVGILQVKSDGSVGRDISRRSRGVEDRGHVDHVPANLSLYDGRGCIWIVRRIGGAQKNIVAAKCNIVIAAAMGSRAE